MTVREYSGSARATTLSGGISAAATSLSVADGTGYPTGATGPFVVTVDAGNAAEEKILVTSRTGNTMSVSARGWDGTTASDHDNAASVAHTFSATCAREANQHVNTTADPHVTDNGEVLQATLASDYPLGVSYTYVVTGDGWPLRGICTTTRFGSTSCVQHLQGDASNAVQIRYAPNGNLAGAWSAWTAL